MGYNSDMAKCFAYIEEHIDELITAVDLAALLGYSYFHFCHVFRNVAGISVGMYLRARRLAMAAADLIDGESVTNAALRRGFDTPSGFTRAFVRTYGVSPLEYKMKGGIMNMENMGFEVKTFGPCVAVGYSLAPPTGDINVRDNGAYWLGKDFSSVSKEDYAKLDSINHGEIGAWTHPDDKTGDLYYFFGPITKDKSFIPGGMTALDIPKAEYAVFKVDKAENPQDLAENVRKAWRYIFNDWFDASEYTFNESAMDFEYYYGDDTFIYVPVIKK